MEINFDYRFNSLATAMFEHANQTVMKSKKIRTSRKAYHCIHLEPARFIRILNQVKAFLGYQNSPHSFIDIGCGLGQKTCLAALDGLESSGLELRGPYVKKAQNLMRQYFKNPWFNKEVNETRIPKIFQGDAIKFRGYKRYDIIYFYRPSPDEKIQGKIELAIAKRAKIGAIVIAVYSQSFHDLKFRELNGWENLKNKNGQVIQDCYIKTK